MEIAEAAVALLLPLDHVVAAKRDLVWIAFILEIGTTKLVRFAFIIKRNV